MPQHRIRILRPCLVANAGLLPATLARHLGLRELVDHQTSGAGTGEHWGQDAYTGRFRAGRRRLHRRRRCARAGGTVGVLGCVVPPWGQLPVGAWSTRGAGPGEHRPGLEMLAKEGARHHYTGARGYHPLLAIAAGREVLMLCARAVANTARGAAHFLRETVWRVR